ncbi:MAG: helicase-exonuclease AddAB subunit AddA [Lachnospiraceae bacterium]|nr:helicase-exonuclease AddAB subunit AddA [Lachnospiraceae bacterium]
MQYTPDQEKVIRTRDSNLLVSAAAGSGKTAVLVERIIQRITDPVSPVDIDRLLVVTFTNAAAAQMKERIRLALETRLNETPEDEALIRQRSLLSVARITTIHSFCLTVLKDHFNRIGLDPQFRIGDEAELSLIREEAMERVMERVYEEKRPEFYDLLEHYSRKRDDSDITEQIKSLYEYSLGKSDPEDWLKQTVRAYEGDGGHFFWEGELLNCIKARLKEAAGECGKALKLCDLPPGPYFYAEIIEEELTAFKECLDCPDFEGLSERLSVFSFRTLPAKRDSSVDTGLRDRVKALRGRWKDTVKSLQEKFCSRSRKEEYEAVLSCAPFVSELIRLVILFGDEFHSMKEERRIVDFSDLEHLGLAVLKSGADEVYREFFREVMVDEYQDVSPVQEAILTAVAPEKGYFCVGDVKQSIYGFRLADPSIFINRYERSSAEEGSARIDLKKNFRSRPEVLDAVNFLFEKTMSRECGGVDYDEAQRLYPGAEYNISEQDYTSELNIYENNSDEELTSAEFEAYAVALRIKELMGSFRVEENGETRELRYGDIAVLLRSPEGREDAFETAFSEAGIPVRLQTHTGYFQTVEIRIMLSFLTVIDNPRQDIPLMAVLKSLFGGFDDSELALIREAEPEGGLFDALKAAAEDTSSGLGKRAAEFLLKLEHYRDMTLDRPIHEIIESIIEDYHYELVAGAGGEVSVMNLRLLAEKAAAFEESSYRGLFHFIRYIEQLKKYQFDPGEGVQEGAVDAVNVMSIHRSKGLEFPVVFLCALEKRFNLRDTCASVVTDSELGIGIDTVDTSLSLRAPTLLKSLIAERKGVLSRAEELRVLYVAMTRAKEKLIMSGVVKDAEKAMDKEEVSPASASSFLDIILGALGAEKEGGPIRLRSISLMESVLSGLKEEEAGLRKGFNREELLFGEAGEEEERDEIELLRRKLFWCDLREEINSIPLKAAVTAFTEHYDPEGEERLRMVTDEEEDPASDTEAGKQAKRRGSGNSSGALRGVAYHKALELVNINSVQSIAGAEEYLSELVRSGQLDEEGGRLVKPEDIASYCNTPLAERMGRASLEGRLFREQPFIVSRSARILNETFPEDQQVLIQGIIDAFFYEDDEIVVVDYKTDRVEDGEILKKRYSGQLAFYADALEQLTGKKVKEKLIYSVSLGREILL